MSKDQCVKIYEAYTVHEKKFGERTGIESVITKKRRLQYEDEVTSNPMNYDAWFDYIRLVESEGIKSDVREIYERAIANVPPSKDKQVWSGSKFRHMFVFFTVILEFHKRPFTLNLSYKGHGKLA